jgi:tetratricopeptide (TPR) repeat protein
MQSRVLFCLALVPLASAEQWIRARTPNFDLLTTGSEGDARHTIIQFEHLRDFFLQHAVIPEGPSGPVRVIAFRSAREYAPYRLSEGAAAYYAGSGSRDFIVISSVSQRDSRIPAHEYMHLIARHNQLDLLPWLSEGLAEVFSTLQFRSGRVVIGSIHSAHLRQLRQGRGLPLTEFLMNTSEAVKQPMFYAQSWALTHMLMFAPSYRKCFSALLAKGGALNEACEKPLSEIERDLIHWLAAPHLPSVELPDGPNRDASVIVEPMAALDAQFALAELLAVIGKLPQAADAYAKLEAVRPAHPEIQAGLGRIALAAGKRKEARHRYQRAVALGIGDARLYYDYVTLASDAGLPETEMAAVLEQALKMDPALDDARYHLALLHMNAGRYRQALQHFQALRLVPAGRAFAYYSALAHTELELGLREAAAQSASEARKYAHGELEETRAGELSWMAQSEIVVQLSPDGSGRLRRIPLRNPQEPDRWNPFIAPGDRIQRAEGFLGDVDCSAGEIRLTVLRAEGTVTLSIPDLGHVQVRQAGTGPFEFICGPQEHTRVLVEYAVAADPHSGLSGVLRGIELLKTP